MNITRGKKKEAQKVVVYGPEGIGKSTFASKFPNPLFVDPENSTGNLEVARFDRPNSFTMLMEQFRYVKQNPSVCNTLVLDTADWAEILIINEICAKKQITGIEDIGYGKGYVYVAEEFGRMLNLLEEVKEKGIHIVINAHAQMRKFEQPDELGAYDRWELKLKKQTAPLLKEWADMVLFANYKTMVINIDNQGAAKGKNKAQGGKRVMYTSHHPCWDAKNRHNLPEEIPMKYDAIAPCIPALQSNTINNQDKLVEKEVSTSIETNKNEEEKDGKQQVQREKALVREQTKKKEESKEAASHLPKNLLDLMREFSVTEEEIQGAVASRGYYPIDTQIENYDPQFISGVLVVAWESVFKLINENKKANGEFYSIQEEMEEMPFN